MKGYKICKNDDPEKEMLLHVMKEIAELIIHLWGYPTNNVTTTTNKGV